jgi:DNA-binding winged helix-turn-helix (wHTH) protein
LIYRFESFELDRSQYRLAREHVTIPIKRMVLDVLAYLVEHRDRVVTREELLSEVWRGRFVSDGVLSLTVHEARRALGEDAHRGTFIKTLHGRGYQFLWRPVEELAGEEPPRREAVVAYLQWAGGQTPLPEGAHFIGRDATSTVVLDSLRVSRHHARLAVSSSATVVEDLGSKNGTLLNGVRVSQPTSLCDGDVLEICGVAIRFRLAGSDLSTVTSVEEPPWASDRRARSEPEHGS